MIDVEQLMDKLKKNSAESYSQHEAISFFRKPPMLNDNLLSGNHLLVGVRGSGKSTLLMCYYRFLLTSALCELSLGRKASFFPVLVKLKKYNNKNAAQINDEILNEIKQGIFNTLDDIRNCNKVTDWEEICLNLPLRHMRDIEEFKYYYDEYFDITSNKFKYFEKFFNQKADSGHIFKLLNAFTYLVSSINSADNIEDLDKACSDYFSDKDLDGYVGRFIFLIDNISSVGESFFNENTHFTDLLESFRKCKMFQYVISLIDSSKSDYFAKPNLKFFTRNRITYDIESIEGLLDTRRFLVELLYKFLNVPDINELIDIHSDIDEDYSNYQGSGDALEQLAYASKGVPRSAFLIILDALRKYRNYKGLRNIEPLQKSELLNAIKTYGELHLAVPDPYMAYSQELCNECKKVGVYRFNCNYENIILRNCIISENNEPFLTCIEEFNKDNISTYAFHYAYCVYKDIPSHSTGELKDGLGRSIFTGKWINITAKINFDEEKGFTCIGVDSNE